MTRTTIRSEDITDGQIKSADLASDAVDTTSLETDIALLGFKVAANGSLAAYNLKDQTIDAFEDASGIDSSASTDEARNAANYYSASGESYVAKGGGAGGNRVGDASGPAELQDGSDGGSGGGGGVDLNGDGHTTDGGSSNKNTYSGWLSYGNEGGQGQHIAGSHEGGGGGGSPNQTGRHAATSTGGNGSTGYETGISGTSTYYGQGGPGSGNSDGSAAANGGASAWSAGAANTGRGGGANGAGGSGVMYIKYTPSGGSATTDSFTSSGTWTVPASTTQVDIFMIGGGGPGGSGGSGGGRGGGAVPRNTTSSVTPGQQWTVTIGAGGVASTSNSVLGTNGGDTSITYAPASMTLVSNSTTAQATPTTGDIVMTYTDGSGTATVNTDLKAYISRDNGTTWTQATLSSEGTTGGHTILTAHNVDISSQPSGTSMRYKIETLNQSASKETRIQAVSLGWS